jgi:alkanesulfonate monooxygenase SsuD/methylene tetrahydromethanopterin reductase-like flavin-dependent oxidoreductase (luciferase family)
LLRRFAPRNDANSRGYGHRTVDGRGARRYRIGMLTFGVFDHLDDNGTPRGVQFEERLKLVELLEAEGFYGYHLAEHHSTPLGTVPSPSVFLAALAQRTRRIRFGPLVYVLPLHHPLRLYEEVCMLDHMSGGRLLLGVGRGGALLEHQRYGIDPATAQAMYHEAFEVLMRACTSDVLDFDGRFYRFKDYVVTTKPLQRPHPPIWYGAPNAEAIGWAAPRGVNVVSLGPAARARDISIRYRGEWAALGRKGDDLPMIGITRHIVVADTDGEAQRIARDAYAGWRAAMEFIWERSAVDFVLAGIYPKTFEELQAIGHGIAGSPATVRAYLDDLKRETGINYLLGQMVFGAMKFADAARSLQHFAREVMPAFRRQIAGTRV